MNQIVFTRRELSPFFFTRRELSPFFEAARQAERECEQTKEGKQMSEPNAKEVSQTQNSKLRFIFIVVAAQLQGFAGYFKKKDAHLSEWLYWAGKCIQAFINGTDLPEEPKGIDSFNSPLSNGVAASITFAGYQLQSLGITIALWDDDDLGKDDKFAHLLQRISSVLITLGNN